MTSRSTDEPGVIPCFNTMSGHFTGSKRPYGTRAVAGPVGPNGTELPARSAARARTRYFTPYRNRGSLPGTGVKEVSSLKAVSAELGTFCGTPSGLMTLPGRGTVRLQPLHQNSD